MEDRIRQGLSSVRLPAQALKARAAQKQRHDCNRKDATAMRRKGMFLLFSLVGYSMIGGAGSAAPGDPPSPIEVEIEGGPVWQSVNDVQIPNNASGTRFSIVDVIGSGPFAAGRMYVTWNVNERHGIRVLLAPFSVTDSGEIAAPVDFAGESFAPGPVQATYRFNSWRATYRYRFRNGERASWWIGFTAKIRDAKIELDQEGATARKLDVGFVPLLHFAGSVRLRERLHFVLDLDAIAGGPGRAEDVALKLQYAAGDRWRFSAGYRTVEGGADVEEVYTFAWLHYATLSAEMRF